LKEKETTKRNGEIKFILSILYLYSFSRENKNRGNPVFLFISKSL